MGRWSYSNRAEADGLKKIDVRFLKKLGYFKGWSSGTLTWTHGYSGSKSSISIQTSILEGDEYLRLTYTQTDRDTIEKTDFDYKVQLVTTPCNYGGKRYWFICPLVKSNRYCGRRVGVLYKAGNYFGCRHCYHLTYSSRKANRHYKLYHLFRILDIDMRVEKIRETMKKFFYAGKPTRKMRQIMKLDQGLEPYQKILLRNDKNGIL